MPPYFSVKEAVFPFIKFPGVDTILGPEMKSTGEVMGVGETLRRGVPQVAARGRRQAADGGTRVHQRQEQRQAARDRGRDGFWSELGFTLVATRGTAAALAAAGVPVTPVNKVAEGRPHIVDMIKNDEIALVINTVEEKRSAIQDSYAIRREALTDQVPTYTTLAGARAAAHRHAPGCASSSRTRCRRCTSGCLTRRQHSATWPERRTASGDSRATMSKSSDDGRRARERLKAELHRLKTVDRPAVIQAIAEARSHGDLSENADYDAAKERQGFIEGRIAEIEHKLADAQVIDPADDRRRRPRRVRRDRRSRGRRERRSR